MVKVIFNIISAILRCSRGVGNCHNVHTLDKYSRPILLQVSELFHTRFNL